MYNRSSDFKRKTFCNSDELQENLFMAIQTKLFRRRKITSVSIQTHLRVDFSTVPLNWISEHDDDFGIRLDCVDEVLSQERGLCLLPVSRKIAPGLVVPHSGCTGFTCQHIDSLSITLGEQHFIENAASSVHSGLMMS